ncbi:hypothetical protein [uncultured Pedobacter sp.]|uniref:hypothetical protein n=1 Tax=uncultured Pedobacter sp. TaxID=246139 RepID=UPI0025D4F89B|nr:hypothetical protein [uncultured Pedobacter sp.]
MSTKQVYANNFGKEISENQVNKSGDYLLKFYNEDKLIKIQQYLKGVLEGTSYNLNSNDDIQSILTLDPNCSFQIESQQGNYKLYECISYENKVMVDRQVFVEPRLLNKTICRHVYNIATNTVKHVHTIKIYYDVNGKDLYEFEYNDQGECVYVNNLQEYQANFYAANIGIDPDLDFTWQGFEYYQFSEPLIPV